MNAPIGIFRALFALALTAALSACGGGSSNNVSVALGGNVTGLTSGTLVLSDNVASVTLTPTTTTFNFPSRIPVGSAYIVGVTTQPVGLTCTVTNYTGVASNSDINNLVVTCVPNQNVGGTITGLTSAGLTLVNGADALNVPANSTTFVMPVKVGRGKSYGVTVLAQPTGLACTVQNGVGTVVADDVTNLLVACQ
ncbi:Flp pilus assembly protein TadG [Actimicrobium sp. GrIS 1.19]|uniref:hypothetical protein n=1 Tax=Actimicrobium sp. GrIS 1.19 TaxID=3071708 RepID=UPI002E07FD37|nr:Flp pilus assembly protein TadG [Actimicrobium sp. GrIS 1.19]